MKMSRVIPLLLAGVVVTAQAAEEKAADPASDCYELQKLTYMDSRVFDAGLDQVIRRGCTDVEISLFTEVKLDKLPERLDTWFERIISAGGGMAVVPATLMPVDAPAAEGSRGLEAAALDEAAAAVS